MPQVDVDTLVCGSDGDGKVSCEALVTATLTLPDHLPSSSLLDPDPNLPPESIRVPIDSSSIDYLDLAAAVYDRDDSTKESTNPKSHNSHQNPNPNNSRSNSQRYAAGAGPGTNIKANGPIIGLPNKIKHVTCTISRPRTPSTNARIFPKKKSGASKSSSAVPEVEPSSPKVSCIGKVLSDRERRGRCRSSHRQSPQPGCFASLFACGGKRRKKLEAGEGEETAADVAGGKIRLGKNISAAEASPAPAPGLGGMNRFASGRRSASWGSDVDVGDGHVAVELCRRSFDEVKDGGPAHI